ncbi:MAG: sulfatase family protein [Planctomycetota bacterium]
MDRRDFIKAFSARTVLLTLPGVLAAAKNDNRPNILLLFAEDICPDLSCYGVPAVKTLVLDKMADDGIRFTHAFTTGPVCSASRSAIMCGMYQTSIGAHNHRTRNKQPLPTPVKPFPQLLRRAGYYTVIKAKTDLNFQWDKNAALDSIEDWSGRAHGQPFFCQMTFGTTHRKFKRDSQNPIDPKTVDIPPIYPEHPIIRRDWTDYLESIQIMDRQVGRILKRLDDEGVAENTLVIFAGDHGRCMPRAKQFLYDGGISIPLIVRWPKSVRPAQVRDEMISAIDIAATILKCAGLDVPDWMQGRPFLPVDRTNRKYVFAARDRCDGTIDRIRCVRSRDYKYIKNFYPERPYTQLNTYKEGWYPGLAVMKLFYKQGTLTPAQAHFMAPKRPAEELYELRTDPHELKNLAGDKNYAHLLRQYRAQLDTWINATGDMGEKPEDPAEVHRQYDVMAARHKANLERIGVKDGDLEAMVAYWQKALAQTPAHP